MTVGCTGHRPNKLGGYDARIAIAEATLSLEIPLVAAIPFEGQERRWPEKSQAHYQLLLKNAKEVHIVSKGGYSGAAMDKRNHWVVDHSDFMTVLWNGTSGGTANCVRYVEKCSKTYANVWFQWQFAA